MPRKRMGGRQGNWKTKEKFKKGSQLGLRGIKYTVNNYCFCLSIKLSKYEIQPPLRYIVFLSKDAEWAEACVNSQIICLHMWEHGTPQC